MINLNSMMISQISCFLSKFYPYLWTLSFSRLALALRIFCVLFSIYKKICPTIQYVYFSRILNKRRMLSTWLYSSACSIRLIIPSQLLSLKYVLLLVLIIITFSDAFSSPLSYSVQYLSAVKSIIIISVNEYTSI